MGMSVTWLLSVTFLGLICLCSRLSLSMVYIDVISRPSPNTMMSGLTESVLTVQYPESPPCDMPLYLEGSTKVLSQQSASSGMVIDMVLSIFGTPSLSWFVCLLSFHITPLITVRIQLTAPSPPGGRPGCGNALNRRL